MNGSALKLKNSGKIRAYRYWIFWLNVITLIYPQLLHLTLLSITQNVLTLPSLADVRQSFYYTRVEKHVPDGECSRRAMEIFHGGKS